uniref:Phosphoinositide-3-kinase regulatory subunit 5 n=1 Tax=Molossus molossus TaxID=27622 RepID=A0A7J8D0K9_MOLMO|nr:phosphoinositide-3-kinase regulatory subunit 5 [Molossus molossus]
MQPGATTCTEDRIQHALERCLHGLSFNRHRSSSWSGRSEGTRGVLLKPKQASGAAGSPGRGMEAGRFWFQLCDFADSWISWAVLGTAPDGEALSVQQCLLSPALPSSPFPELYLLPSRMLEAQ